MEHDNQLIKNTLEEYGQGLEEIIKAKKERLLYLKKEFYKFKISNEFKLFINETSNNAEGDYLLTEIDDLEKEIRILENKFKRYHDYKDMKLKDL